MTKTTTEYMSQKHYSEAAITVEPLVLCAQFPFCFGNVIKYLSRAEFKGDKLSDLKKALRYLDEHLSNSNDHSTVCSKLCNDDTIRRLIKASNNAYLQPLANNAPIAIFDLRDKLEADIRGLEA